MQLTAGKPVLTTVDCVEGGLGRGEKDLVVCAAKFGGRLQ